MSREYLPAGFQGILLVLVCALFCAAGLEAQDLLLDELPALKDKALVLQITTRIEENSQEVWNAYNSKVTIPGRPVSIKLVGENIIINIQFIPYLREGNYALVTQSQIWLNVPEKGMQAKTATHSIPINFGEPIYFFPLGSDPSADNPHIELLLTLYRYGEEPLPEAYPDLPSSTPVPDSKAPAAAAPALKAVPAGAGVPR
ncbi:MAG: hypothetical protein LBK77_04620 [Spirochaetaceae bacterium]|jgi:hypothetical protein|nr:hypothetical protein [Spirochaetaceae bacterium]